MIVAGVYKVERVVTQGVNTMTVAATHDVYRTPVMLELAWPVHIDSQTIQTFLQQTRVAAQMKCPNAARVIDAGALDDGGFYLASEVVEGDTLTSMLAQRGTLTPNSAAHFIQKVANVLIEAHPLGLVHRTLDLDHIFSTANGVKLTGLTSLIALLDTPYAIDPRNNISALGTMLYTLVTGHPPTAPHTPLAGIPAGLLAIAERCMDPDPTKRYPRAHDVALALAPFTSPAVHREGPRFTPANVVAVDD
jgi:serine/threonine-protein kinase